jgi:hypothetical protein
MLLRYWTLVNALYFAIDLDQISEAHPATKRRPDLPRRIEIRQPHGV